MEDKTALRIVLESPTPGVDFSLQNGRRKNYGTIQSPLLTFSSDAFLFYLSFLA
ncbi:MAG TPA: hypothetical protein VGP55_03775 [Chitinophagaceae bacterium]|nr:hypothetical protein [Chitinophagaceae bacterium]